MESQPLTVTLLGFTIDDEQLNRIAEASSVLPTQTHRFAWNLVAALNSAEAQVSLLSVLPIPNYPEYPNILIRSSIVIHNQACGRTLGFINLLVLKHLSRLYSCLRHGIGYVRERRPDVVVVHGVHTPFLLFAQILKRMFKVQICLVMTDPPGVVRQIDGPLSRLLKRFDRGLVTTLAGRFDGLICLTAALGEDFAPAVPRLVLEGFADPALARFSVSGQAKNGQFVIAYAGATNAEYGVINLIHAIRAMSNPELRLHIYGKGPLDSWVVKQCAIDERIIHHGLVPHQELMQKLANASVLVNPRPSSQDFVKYSFPSKLLEYMTLGVPVISTRLSGIPNDYLPYLEVTRDDTPEALIHAINEIRNNSAHAAGRAVLAQKYVIRQKSLVTQGRRMIEFLQSKAGCGVQPGP